MEERELAELHYAPATRIAHLIRSGAISSRAVVQMFITRIEAYDGPEGVNAVVVRDFARALDRAAAADAAAARGEFWGALHGVPLTVKENNDVEGLPTTLGDASKCGHKALRNSPPVQRLLDAGAVILGKTNLALHCNDVQSYNEVYGCTRNPHDLSVTAGGSSGGSAAALAAGLTALELGGDIGGSIRTPAHCCGVFGHKATFGIIPIGHQDIVVKGPLARSAEDLALALDIVAGPVGGAARGWRLSLPSCPKQYLREFRVAVWANDPLCPVDQDVAAAFAKLVEALRKAGVHVDETARPAFDVAEVWSLYRQLLAAAENTSLSPQCFEASVEAAKCLEATDQTDLASQKRWIVQSHHAWHEAHVRREKLRDTWEAFFETFDVLVCPICCSDAWPHDFSGSTDQPFWKVGERIIPGNGLSTAYHRQVFWSGLTNLAYNPSTAFPVGRSAAGLPIGLQAVGPEFADHTTIAFAAALSKEVPHLCAFRPPTGLPKL